MRKLFTTLAALTCTIVAWAQNNVITYTAYQQLPEIEEEGQGGTGLHLEAFLQAGFDSHNFDGGTGTITFYNDVTTIGANAFDGCSIYGLTSVSIPQSVESIENDALAGCGMKSITIPSGVTSIGARAFTYCTSLSSVTVKAATPATIGENVFEGCAENLKIYVPKESVATYKAASGWSTYADMIEAIFEPIAIDETNFADATFRSYVSTSFDTDKDGKLSKSEIASATSINVSEQNIASLKGIEIFTALTSLVCFDNKLTALDVSSNTALTKLSCGYNQLTALDISSNTELTILSCDKNQLTALDISKNTKLKTLFCYNNKLTELNLSNNTALTQLSCNNNELTTLDLSNNTKLSALVCDNNKFTTLDFSNNRQLNQIYCSSNKLTSINISKNNSLIWLECNDNQLTTLDVSPNASITHLSCSNNQLIALDLSTNTILSAFECDNNMRTLGKVDFSGFSVEGLDMTKVSNVSGATVDESGKFVPTDATVTEITYSYNAGNATFASVTFKLIIERDATTGVSDIKAQKAQKAYKTIENGQIVIVKGGVKYDITGRKL